MWIFYVTQEQINTQLQYIIWFNQLHINAERNVEHHDDYLEPPDACGGLRFTLAFLHDIWSRCVL